jgi:hypothetical protein
LTEHAWSIKDLLYIWDEEHQKLIFLLVYSRALNLNRFDLIRFPTPSIQRPREIFKLSRKIFFMAQITKENFGEPAAALGKFFLWDRARNPERAR